MLSIAFGCKDKMRKTEMQAISRFFKGITNPPERVSKTSKLFKKEKPLERGLTDGVCQSVAYLLRRSMYLSMSAAWVDW